MWFNSLHTSHLGLRYHSFALSLFWLALLGTKYPNTALPWGSKKSLAAWSPRKRAGWEEDKAVFLKLDWNRSKEVKGIYSSQTLRGKHWAPQTFHTSCLLAHELVGKVSLQQAAGVNCHESNQVSGDKRTEENICGSSQEISPHRGVELDIRSNYQLLSENRTFVRAGHNRHAPGCSASVEQRRNASSKGSHPLLQMIHLARRVQQVRGKQ